MIFIRIFNASKVNFFYWYKCNFLWEKIFYQLYQIRYTQAL